MSYIDYFFTAIKQSDVDDVREVLRYYKQFDDPIEAFRENQRKLQVPNISNLASYLFIDTYDKNNCLT